MIFLMMPILFLKFLTEFPEFINTFSVSVSGSVSSGSPYRHRRETFQTNDPKAFLGCHSYIQVSDDGGRYKTCHMHCYVCFLSASLHNLYGALQPLGLGR